MITLISTILGLISSVLPNLVKILEKRQDYSYELELFKLKMEATEKGMEYQAISDSVKADVEEGKSLRLHDTSIAYGGIMETVRASIRPVLTYFFFILFCTVKLSAISLMYKEGYDSLQVLEAVWDIYTASIFGAVMGFWFGSRAIEKISQSYEMSNIKEK